MPSPPHKNPRRRARTACLAVLTVLLISISALTLIPGETAAYSWRTQTIDSGGAETFGLLSDLVIDAADRPHIAYYAEAGGLRYATRTAEGGWIIETIDATPGASSPSIALDGQGRPHVAYDAAGIIYASRTVEGWELDRVGDGNKPSLVIDAANRPHIAYKALASEQRYAYHDGAEWIIEFVDTAGDKNNGAHGCSIALDSNGDPGIAYAGYHTLSGSPLKYAHRAGGIWTNESTSLRVASDRTNGLWGTVSLAYTKADTPHIAFVQQSPPSHMVSYAIYSGSGWSSTDIAKGLMSSMTIDQSGVSHVTYREYGNYYYAHNGGGGWATEKICTVPFTNSIYTAYPLRMSLAVDSSGMPHLSGFAKYSLIYNDVPFWRPAWTSEPAEAITLNHEYRYTPQINETGTISVQSLPDWLTWDGATLRGTPATLGSWGVSLRATSADGGGSITQEWTIDVEGWRPAWTTNPRVSVVTGNQYTYTPGTNESATIVAFQIPSWLTWDGATLRGTPAESGSWAVSLRATGPGLLSSWQNYTIRAHQWAPTFTIQPPWSAIVDNEYRYTPQINETGTISVQSLPDWLTWDGATLRGTPGAAEMGAWPCSISATGPGKLTRWLNWTVTVSDRDRWMPQVSSSPADKVMVGAPYAYTIKANESVTVSYSGPAWLHLDGLTVSGTAPPVPQSVHVSLRITSAAGTLSYWQNWTVAVWALPPAIIDPPEPRQPRDAGLPYCYEFGGAGWGSESAPGELLLTVETNASWVSVGTYNGTIYGDPWIPGEYYINATVTDTTTGLSTSTNWTVVVEAEPPLVESTHDEVLPDEDGEGGSEGGGGPGIPTDTVWAGHPYSYALMISPARVQVTYTTDAAWLTYDAETKAFAGTPLKPGVHQVSVRLYDPLTTLESWDNWTIRVIAEPPAVTSSLQVSLLVGAPWSYYLQYRPADALVIIETEANWITYNATSCTFSGTPTAAGTYSVAVTVRNETSGMEAVQHITITVTLDAPILVCNPPRSATERTLYQWTAAADQVVTWRLSGEAGSWLTIGSGSGRVSGTPTAAGTYSITVTGTNDRGVSSSYTYNLTVAPYKSGGGTTDPGSGGGTITLPGGIEIPIGGNASYSTSVEGPVIAFVIIAVLLLFLLLRRRD